MKNLILCLLFFLSLCACKKDENKVTCPDAGQVFSTSPDAMMGMNLYIDLHNSLYLPSFAVWTQEAGKIKTLYVTCKAAYRSWDGAAVRKEALPVWFAANKAEIAQPELFELDGVTSATPDVSPFTLLIDLFPVNEKDTLNIFVEVNAAYDMNEYYTGDINGQPSVVWKARTYQDSTGKNITGNFRIIGHGSVDGLDGEINPDTSMITTAASLIEKITVNP